MESIKNLLIVCIIIFISRFQIVLSDNTCDNYFKKETDNSALHCTLIQNNLTSVITSSISNKTLIFSIELADNQSLNLNLSKTDGLFSPNASIWLYQPDETNSTNKSAPIQDVSSTLDLTSFHFYSNLSQNASVVLSADEHGHNFMEGFIGAKVLRFSHDLNQHFLIENKTSNSTSDSFEHTLEDIHQKLNGTLAKGGANHLVLSLIGLLNESSIKSENLSQTVENAVLHLNRVNFVLSKATNDTIKLEIEGFVAPNGQNLSAFDNVTAQKILSHLHQNETHEVHIFIEMIDQKFINSSSDHIKSLEVVKNCNVSKSSEKYALLREIYSDFSNITAVVKDLVDIALDPQCLDATPGSSVKGPDAGAEKKDGASKPAASNATASLGSNSTATSTSNSTTTTISNAAPSTISNTVPSTSNSTAPPASNKTVPSTSNSTTTSTSNATASSISNETVPSTSNSTAPSTSNSTTPSASNSTTPSTSNSTTAPTPKPKETSPSSNKTVPSTSNSTTTSTSNATASSISNETVPSTSNSTAPSTSNSTTPSASNSTTPSTSNSTTAPTPKPKETSQNLSKASSKNTILVLLILVIVSLMLYLIYNILKHIYNVSFSECCQYVLVRLDCCNWLVRNQSGYTFIWRASDNEHIPLHARD